MQDWEEILFDDRNKSYGSYHLRKKYSKYLLWGFVIAIAVTILPLGIVFIQSQQPDDYSDMPYIVSVELDKPPDLESEFSPPPMEEKKQDIDHEQVPLVVDSTLSALEHKKEMQEKTNNDADSTETADNGNSQRGNGFNLNGDSSTLYRYIDSYPEFPGGMRALNSFISQNVVYPTLAEKQRIEGKVIVQFIVTATGDIRNISIKKSVNQLLDNEAVRVVRLFPKWKPAKRKGLPIPLIYRLPICFKLNYTKE